MLSPYRIQGLVRHRDEINGAFTQVTGNTIWIIEQDRRAMYVGGIEVDYIEPPTHFDYLYNRALGYMETGLLAQWLQSI